MSLTITKGNVNHAGNRKLMSISVDFDDAYPIGGEALTAAMLGLAHIEGVLIENPLRDDYMLAYDKAAGKLKVYHGGGTSKRVSSIYYAAQPQVTAEAATSVTADQAACVGYKSVADETAVADGAWAVGDITNPAVPRNVRFVIHNDSGGNLNAYVGTMTATITGTYRGKAQTETIALAIADGEKVIANTKFRWKDGVKAWDTITAVTVDHVPANGLKMSVGLGTRYGFPNGLYSNDVGNVIHCAQNETAETVDANSVDAVNETFNFGAIAANDEIQMVYWEKSGEVPEAFDLSALTGVRCLVMGY